MVIISTTGHCATCDARTGFTRAGLDEANPLCCRKCGGSYAQNYVTSNRRSSMSSRHVKDFYAEGHEVFQAPPNHPNRIVYSRGDEQRVLEDIGISPEDNHTPLKDENGHDIF